MIRNLKFLFWFIFLFFVTSTAFAVEPPNIRVMVLDDLDDVVISARGHYQIIDPIHNMLIFEGDVLHKSRVLVHGNFIYVGKRFFRGSRLRINSNQDITVYLANDKHNRYRGSLDIIMKDKRKFMLVNHLDLETYIKGVLYHEITDRWPIDAMKAQAVAARSYAVYQASENVKMDFDVKTNIYSQVYGGKNAERFRTSMAVDQTRNEVLVFENKVLPAYFHSNCGDHTEDVAELWNHHGLSPLRGIPDPYSRFGKNYSWKKNFKSEDVQTRLNIKGHTIGQIVNIEVIERNDSGRIRKIKITDKDGGTLILTGKDFRDILGPNDIRSNDYEVIMQGYYFDVVGKGWGHGVGMSQWGAYEMSKQGFDYKKILEHYYPGADLVQLDSIKEPLKIDEPIELLNKTDLE
ncbi:MAG: SpoIID/LytB domain-containing protein [Candidatus Omnitrophica bacterium]|nr:SpoIID/LytB domain-containing protein [Candidatus Omnitrophota bacterium]